MTIRRQVWKRAGVALVAVSCAALVSLSPQVAVAQEGGDESDFIDRSLPNPTGEAILNWAPLPDNRVWVLISVPMVTSGPMTAVAGWRWRVVVRRTLSATRSSSSTKTPVRSWPALVPVCLYYLTEFMLMTMAMCGLPIRRVTKAEPRGIR